MDPPKHCINFYPVLKNNPGPHPAQLCAQSLGAELYPLKGGMSAVLWYQARSIIEKLGGYMMPNALKLPESVIETAAEVLNSLSSPHLPPFDNVIIPCSSGTIAAGVVLGFESLKNVLHQPPHYIFHMGYSRPKDEFIDYISASSGHDFIPTTNTTNTTYSIIDEGYAYRDRARLGPLPPWPC